MTTQVIPLRAVVPPKRENLASGAACRPAAIPYSSLGNPSNRFDKLFDPIAFNDALYEREIEAVREVISNA